MTAEERIQEYFDANASDDLKGRVAESGKTVKGALAYCTAQARKGATGMSACVDDATVFGWAMHYFEDEQAEKWEGRSVQAAVQDCTASTTVRQKPPRTRSKALADGMEQMDLFGSRMA